MPFLRSGPRPGDRHPAQWSVIEMYRTQVIIECRGTVKYQPCFFAVPSLPMTQIDGRVILAQFHTLEEARAYIDVTPWRNKNRSRTWEQVQKDEKAEQQAAERELTLEGKNLEAKMTLQGKRDGGVQ